MADEQLDRRDYFHLGGSKPAPRLAEARIDPQYCLPYQGPECGVCGSVCPVPGAIEWDMTRPNINADICTGCALCRVACITEPNSISNKLIPAVPVTA